MTTILATEKETTMATATTERTILVRQYELFDVRWARGSRWTGYWTEAEAQAAVDFADDDGVVERRVWESRWDLSDERDRRLLAISNPGIAEWYEDQDGQILPTVEIEEVLV